MWLKNKDCHWPEAIIEKLFRNKPRSKNVVFKLWYLSEDIIASVMNRQKYKIQHLFFTICIINVVFILMERIFATKKMV